MIVDAVLIDSYTNWRFTTIQDKKKYLVTNNIYTKNNKTIIKYENNKNQYLLLAIYISFEYFKNIILISNSQEISSMDEAEDMSLVCI